jgi:hypothetical protein
MTKKPIWTIEKISTYNSESIRTLMDNARRIGASDVAEMCAAVIAERQVLLETKGRRSSSAVQHTDFVFTWTTAGWDYVKLRALIDQFEDEGTVTTQWRCYAHRMVFVGARAYFFKQGMPHRGIFAVGEVAGEVEVVANTEKGQNPHMVPVRLEMLVDPTREFLVTEAELNAIDPDESVWDSQASGMPLKHSIARQIDELLAARALKSNPRQ